MNARAMRRLAGDQAALRSKELPPYYLFAPDSEDNDDLAQLDILLAGPSHTPFAAGVWNLHLSIPSSYPQQPPEAYFRTPIFHPNVDPRNGAVCVETLKRDWDASLTLRDILVVISCLLIQPNPDSALNAEAGALIRDSYDSFARRAKMMTSFQARVPDAIKDAVIEAQNRGQERPAPPRNRTARQRGTAASSRHAGDQSPSVPTRQFVVPQSADDVFDAPLPRVPRADENDESLSSPKPRSLPGRLPTIRRPNGAPVPLGELVIEPAPFSSDEEESDSSRVDGDDHDTDDDDGMEYPPSPTKSPSPRKRVVALRDGVRRNHKAAAMDITPPGNYPNPLAFASPFTAPRSTGLKERDASPSPMKGLLFPKKVTRQVERDREETEAVKMNRTLWEKCGHDVHRWNNGDFDGGAIQMRLSRW